MPHGKPRVSKRRMRSMPERPAESISQLRRLPTPSEVATPIPVTQTAGPLIMGKQSRGLGAQVTDAGNKNAIDWRAVALVGPIARLRAINEAVSQGKRP